MKMSQNNIELAEKIREQWLHGLKYTEIARQFGISPQKARYLKMKYERKKAEDDILTEFPGLDWIPAYGLYKGGIRTREQLENCSDDVILFVLDHNYPSMNRSRIDLLEEVLKYLGRQGADVNADG